MERGELVSAFDDAVAECRRDKLGTSACLEHINPFCDGNPEASFVGPGLPVAFTCKQPIGAQKAAVILAETQQRIAAANNARASSTPLLVVGGLVLAGLLVYAVTR